MKLRREISKVVLAISATVLILGGAVNLKNYHDSFSVFELSYSSFFAPLMWMAWIGFGVYLGAKYVKMEYRS